METWLERVRQDCAGRGQRIGTDRPRDSGCPTDGANGQRSELPPACLEHLGRLSDLRRRPAGVTRQLENCLGGAVAAKRTAIGVVLPVCCRLRLDFTGGISFSIRCSVFPAVSTSQTWSPWSGPLPPSTRSASRPGSQATGVRSVTGLSDRSSTCRSVSSPSGHRSATPAACSDSRRSPGSLDSGQRSARARSRPSTSSRGSDASSLWL